MAKKNSKLKSNWEETSQQYEQVKNIQTKILSGMGFNKSGKTRVGNLANNKMQIK